MFKPKIPNQIRTLFELKEFMDYVVKGFADDVDYQVVFSSVGVMEDHYSGTIEINIPIAIPQDKEDVFITDFVNPLSTVVKELKHRSSYLINLEVHFNRSFLPLFKGKFIVEMEENKMYIPEVEKIIHKKSHRGEFFSVIWKDNTKTTVKLAEGEESDEYSAFCYALCKKLFKDKGKVRELIKEKKKVFEYEMEQRIAEKNRQRRALAVQQSLNARDFDDIEAEVYGQMFVAPALVSRTVFRKNR